MKVELRKWTMDDCARMAEICTLLDRSYLSDQLPDPYTEDSAAWWINMALEKEGKEGVFRAILADGTVVGNISVERKQDVYRQDAEIGYFLLTERWSKGIMTVNSWILSVSQDWYMLPILLPGEYWKRTDLNWKGF